MFSDLTQARQRLAALAGKQSVRIGVAAALALFHLAMFAAAGGARLNLPFNTSPSEAPYFVNERAPATIGYPREPRHWSRLIASRWDAQHYIGMATRGLSACPTDKQAPDLEYLECGLGWLPAWGKVGGTVARITQLSPDVTLILLSLLATIAINFFWMSSLVVQRLGLLEAYATAFAFNMFPSAFHLVTPYTEAATLALALGALFAVSKERWILAGLLVGASTALKISASAFGIGLGAAALFAAWQRRTAKTPKWWQPLWAIPLCGWGQLVEMGLLRIYTGDAMAFWRARNAFGDPHDFSRLFDSQYYLKGFHAQHMDGVIFLGVVAIVALTGYEVLKKLTRPEAIYIGVASMIMLAMVIVAPLVYWGINRYLLLCPLAFLGMGVMLRKYPGLFVLWIALCLVFYWKIELCSYVAQGDPRICPCLGKVEFTFPFGS